MRRARLAAGHPLRRRCQTSVRVRRRLMASTSPEARPWASRACRITTKTTRSATPGSNLHSFFFPSLLWVSHRPQMSVTYLAWFVQLHDLVRFFIIIFPFRRVHYTRSYLSCPLLSFSRSCCLYDIIFCTSHRTGTHQRPVLRTRRPL